MRTSNPALSLEAFSPPGYRVNQVDAMTVQGVVNKTAVLLFCVLLTAGWTWSLYYRSGDPAVVAPWMMGGALLGLIAALVTIFKQSWAPITAPIYSLLQGLFLGGISATLDSAYPGIVVQATALTFGTAALMLFFYKSGIIPVTDKLRMGIFAATGAIALIYLVSIVLGFFGVQVPYIYSNGIVGIGFSLFVVGIAAFNLILDFDFIEQAARRALPHYMEWYAAFGLMVTLIWLYIEILVLLSKIRSR